MEDRGRRSRARTPFFRLSHHLAELPTDILALGYHGIAFRLAEVVARQRRLDPVLGFSSFVTLKMRCCSSNAAW
jgi:hypothetical protein